MARGDAFRTDMKIYAWQGFRTVGVPAGSVLLLLDTTPRPASMPDDVFLSPVLGVVTLPSYYRTSSTTWRRGVAGAPCYMTLVARGPAEGPRGEGGGAPRREGL